MMWLAYCGAIYRLGRDYHSGQWSKGYRLQCLASLELMEAEMNFDYKDYRKALAFWLWKLKHHRHSL